MDLAQIDTFLALAAEGSFSRAGKKLLRTQPAVSLALKRLEEDLGEKLIDRSSKDLVLTDAGHVVLDYSRRFYNLRRELYNSISELRDKQAGKLTIGANETTALYLITHIERFRRLYPKVKVEIRRSLSSHIPDEVLAGGMDLGAISYDPGRPELAWTVIYNDALALVVSPEHRFAGRAEVSIEELGMEIFIAHNVISPYREQVLAIFERQGVPLHMDIEMPTVETIKRLVQRNLGVAFLPKMCVEAEIAGGALVEVAVREIQIERQVRLIQPAKRALSYAGQAFLTVMQGR
jgi:DNA-binding transcriptional LysR family regulator